MKKYKFNQLWFDVVNNTPLSPVWVMAAEKGLVAIEIGGSEKVFLKAQADKYQGPLKKDETGTRVIVQQVSAYLRQQISAFNLPIDWSVMTEFQEKVLRAVCAIPYGETRTYSQIAVQIGMPGAQRAVGHANATNPVPLVIPCHRVIGADGNLRGYGAGKGIETKAWLLELERSNS